MSDAAPSADGVSPPASLSFFGVAVAGAASGFAARFATHPMDTVKTQMQVQGALLPPRGGTTGASSAPPAHASALAAVRAITRAEGIAGLYRGFGAVVVGIPFASAAYFGGYEAARRMVPEDNRVLGPTATYALSGAVAQSLAGIVYTPLDVVKERLQARAILGHLRATGDYANFVSAYASIVRNEGVRGLFRGYWASNFTWWPWNCVYFVAYESARDAVAKTWDRIPEDAEGGESRGREQQQVRVTTKDDLPPWVSSACATAAAALATFATNPLDLAKTRLQTLRRQSAETPAETPARASNGRSNGRSNGLASNGGGDATVLRHRAGVFGVMRDVARKEGPRALMTGTAARVAAVAPGSAISFFVYESVKAYFLREDE